MKNMLTDRKHVQVYEDKSQEVNNKVIVCLHKFE